MKSYMTDSEYIAHVRRHEDGTWAAPHLLSVHLDGVAKLAETFATKFGSGEWGKAMGLAHDAGKARETWQKYIRKTSGYDEEAHLEGKTGKIPHAIHGAILAEALFGKGIGRCLAYCIAGHHAGLMDWDNAEGAGQSSLQYQLSQMRNIKDIDSFITNKLSAAKPTSLPRRFANKGVDFSLWIRMLFSCLVDADFLDTESYMKPTKTNERGSYSSMSELLERYKCYIRKLEKEVDNTNVNKIRRQIRGKCIQMAQNPQGVFSLSVPTGGGKTLSSLAFALEHAVKHGLDRIIYVIPYTSITEQNAAVFRAVVGEDQVVEHHSSLSEDDVTLKSRLAAENWDAPIIVTTAVQFFESLFAAKPSRCRKLHNIVKSVVVFDEAQLIPVDFLHPILETMQLLVDHYRVSIVISTATQPAFGERIVDGKKFTGLKQITEIMGSPNMVEKLYRDLSRVRVKLPENLHEHTSWEEVASELMQYEQVLCIVSERKSCRDLHKLMPEGTIHLSALMCGQHRSRTIEEIKKRLKNREIVRVISTQLVEAGVDMDFPVVYRALTGLDSIAQAAGRCNREGKLPELGKVVVFVPPKNPPAGILRKATDTARSILSTNRESPLDYNLFAKYFAELYWKANSLDTADIIRLLSVDHQECGMAFRTAAERFRIIDDSMQKTILVRYGTSGGLIDLLKIKGPDRTLMRQLQRYTVSVYKHEFNEMFRRGSIEEVYPQIYALTSDIEYSDKIGLLIEPILYDPAQLIQ